MIYGIVISIINKVWCTKLINFSNLMHHIFRVSKCTNADPNSGPASVDIAYPLSPGTVVQRSPDGYRVGVSFFCASFFSYRILTAKTKITEHHFNVSVLY